MKKTILILFVVLFTVGLTVNANCDDKNILKIVNSTALFSHVTAMHDCSKCHFPTHKYYNYRKQYLVQRTGRHWRQTNQINNYRKKHNPKCAW